MSRRGKEALAVAADVLEEAGLEDLAEVLRDHDWSAVASLLPRVPGGVYLVAVEDMIARASITADMPPQVRQDVLRAASDDYGDENIVVDHDAFIHDNDSDGYWVSAFVYVPYGTEWSEES